MRIAILGKPQYLETTDEEMERMVEAKGFYLFTVVGQPGSLSQLYAEKRGAPFEYYNKSFDDLMDYADYFLIVAETGQDVRPLVNRLKRKGKDGKVVFPKSR